MGVVIIGTGLAGYTTAREFRKHDTATPLTLISQDSGRAYSKPQLSTGYRKGQTPNDLAQASPEAMAQELDAEVLAATGVEAVDTLSQRLRLSDGSRRDYRQLVLAVGAEPVPPPLEGSAAHRVFQVNDLDGYAAFRRAADPAERVILLGGGLIGCEFANDLAADGRRVDMVFPEPAPLQALLPARPAGVLARALGELGVHLHTGRLARTVEPEGRRLQVGLDDGETVTGDVVLAAIGLRPRTALACSAGLETGRGIRVDRYLQTSVPGVYALGDCAEVEGYVLQYVAPLTSAARALGATLAGSATPVHYPVMPVTVKTSCCQVVAWPPPEGAEGEWTFRGEGRDLVGEFRGSDERLTGFALTGRAIRERMTLAKEMPDLIGH